MLPEGCHLGPNERELLDFGLNRLSAHFSFQDLRIEELLLC